MTAEYPHTLCSLHHSTASFSCCSLSIIFSVRLVFLPSYLDLIIFYIGLTDIFAGIRS